MAARRVHLQRRRQLEGKVTKVVTFGAFVEIMDGVEGLVHISELAQQHVENPREIVQPGDDVRVKVLEIDSERRRLSLSIKRVEGQVLPRRSAAEAGDLENVPDLGLSEDVFAARQPDAPDAEAAEADDAEAAPDAEADAGADAEVAPDADAEAAPDADAEAAPDADAPATDVPATDAEDEQPAS